MNNLPVSKFLRDHAVPLGPRATEAEQRRVLGLLPPHAKELVELYTYGNGSLAFESSLVVFPLVGSETIHGITAWNDVGLWRHGYGALTTGLEGSEMFFDVTTSPEIMMRQKSRRFLIRRHAALFHW